MAEKGLNEVRLLGRVGKDPDVRFIPSGTGVCKFSMATNERRKTKGEWTDHTEWHFIIAWGKLAEIIGKYVKKGTKVLVTGKLQTSSWEDKQSGEKKYKTEVIANGLILLGDGRNAGVDANIADEDIPF